MGAISLKLPDDLLEASGRCAAALKLSRAAYIRRAVERMNHEPRDPRRGPAGRLDAVAVLDRRSMQE